ncbi:hypothetical protein V8D89_011006 [Ganoderma adspersum]
MSSTTVTGVQSPAPSATFDANLFQTSVLEVRQNFAILGLLGALYGVLTVLSVLAVWALTRRKGQPNARVLCLTILTLFASTTAYMVTCMLSCQYIFLDAFLSSASALSSSSVQPSTLLDAGPSKAAEHIDYLRIHSCASTAAITTNITLGDAIVCWRASVVWYHNRVVRAVLGALLLATAVLSAADTAWGCRAPYRLAPLTIYSFVPLGTSAAGLPLGLAACALSLATNALATLLVACKAWESRRRLWGYLLAGGPGRAQVQKLFALLVESGALYCAIWGVVVAFQTGEYRVGHPAATPVTAGFLNVFNVFMAGGLVPLIAIYPASIIVLVALNRSHVEMGLTQNQNPLKDIDITVPTPHVSAILARIHDGAGDGSRWRVPGSEGSKFEPEDGSDPEDASARTSTSNERKAEETV